MAILHCGKSTRGASERERSDRVKYMALSYFSSTCLVLSLPLYSFLPCCRCGCLYQSLVCCTHGVAFDDSVMLARPPRNTTGGSRKRSNSCVTPTQWASCEVQYRRMFQSLSGSFAEADILHDQFAICISGTSRQSLTFACTHAWI